MRLALAVSGIGILFITMVASATAVADATMSPIGVWATQGAGAHVKIDNCGDKLCGALIWLREPLNKEGKDKIDSQNPDPSLRTRKLAGLPLLSGFAQDESEANVWSGGQIYNPDDGKTYSCNLTLQDANTLRVHGYVLMPILGKTQVWTRVK